MSAPAESQFNRAPIYVALGLAIAMVVGVLIGTKVVYEKVAKQPISLGSVSAPGADAPECQNFIDALPKKLAGNPRAELAESSPAGSAAFASNSAEQITIRCGVEAPAQYTELSQLQDVSGTSWLRVVDSTPGSSLETWFSVGSAPIVAVTADKTSLHGAKDPVNGLRDSVAKLSNTAAKPYPIPLTELRATHAHDPQCDALIHALPEQLGTAYRRTNSPLLPAATAAWTADGLEPVVLRCGVDDAPGYKPGEQLIQVDDLPWFEDSTLANGTTAGSYFAMGRAANVAVSMPKDTGNTAIVTLTTAIKANTRAA